MKEHSYNLKILPIRYIKHPQQYGVIQGAVNRELISFDVNRDDGSWMKKNV